MRINDLTSTKLQGVTTFKHSLICVFLSVFSSFKSYQFTNNSKWQHSEEKELGA